VKTGGLSVRQAALQVLDRYDAGDDTASGLLHRTLEEQKGWGPRERAQLTELVLGTIRWLGRIDWILSQYARGFPGKLSPRVHNILRMGVFQLCYQEGVPSFAAVSETVHLAHRAYRGGLSGYVNAVLRAIHREDGCLRLPNITDQAGYLAVVHSFPRWIVQHRLDLLGPEETEKLCQADNVVPLLTVRTNTLLIHRDELMRELQDEFQQVAPCTFAAEGISVQGARRPVHRMPAFKKGLFYVQDEAAQLIAHLAAPLPEERVLDACAAPGGKTTHMAQLMKNTGRIVAVDINESRLGELRDNYRRMGIRNVEAVAGDMLALRNNGWREKFQRVVLDPPCSSLGIIRRHPDIKWRRRQEEIPSLADVQRRMMRCAADMVQPGGRLVYAVCTTTKEEGEEIVRDFLSSRADFYIETDLPAAGWEIFLDKGIFRTSPHRHGVDGFFAVRFRRKAE